MLSFADLPVVCDGKRVRKEGSGSLGRRARERAARKVVRVAGGVKRHVHTRERDDAVGFGRVCAAERTGRRSGRATETEQDKCIV